MTAAVVLLDDDFEGYSLGALAGQPGSPWIRAVESREGAIVGDHTHSGERALRLQSFTTRSEIDYALLELTAAPRKLSVELWYGPHGMVVYVDFAEFGLARVRSRFDIVPVFTLDFQNHSLYARSNPRAPSVQNTEGVELYNELEYSTSTALYTYVRLELEYCSGIASVFTGPSSAVAELRGAVAFDAAQRVDALFFAGGMNPTYIDDVIVTRE